MSFEGEAGLSAMPTTPYIATQRCREWLAAVLGNTHVRWGWFQGQTLVRVECFSAQQGLSWPENTEIWLATVGSAPLPPGSPWVHRLQLSDVPLGNLYPSLGLDRALALWAAGIHYGWPCLVIDAGTALTLTGGDGSGSLVGGAILPGLGLQAQALSDHTARLPKVQLHGADASYRDPDSPLPPRWASDTPTAIRSGILYTLLAGLKDFLIDWRQIFSGGPVLLTGGDGGWLYPHLQNTDPQLLWDPDLVLRGIAQCRQLNHSIQCPLTPG
jgi:type III pantothenate kinase